MDNNDVLQELRAFRQTLGASNGLGSPRRSVSESVFADLSAPLGSEGREVQGALGQLLR